jgi:hypothetical protein
VEKIEKKADQGEIFIEMKQMNLKKVEALSAVAKGAQLQGLGQRPPKSVLPYTEVLNARRPLKFTRYVVTGDSS